MSNYSDLFYELIELEAEAELLYWTYRRTGGCARCAVRDGERYIPIPGHAVGCLAKAVEDALALETPDLHRLMSATFALRKSRSL